MKLTWKKLPQGRVAFTPHGMYVEEPDGSVSYASNEKVVGQLFVKIPGGREGALAHHMGKAQKN